MVAFTRQLFAPRQTCSWRGVCFVTRRSALSTSQPVHYTSARSRVVRTTTPYRARGSFRGTFGAQVAMLMLIGGARARQRVTIPTRRC